MNTQSRKAKGRNLQKWIVALILRTFVELGPKDVSSRSMGAQGTDVLLSEKAYKCFPYAVEAKNQEVSKTVYDWYEQATEHDGGEPLLIIKRNHSKPLVVVDAEHFMKVIYDARRASNQQTD